MSTVIKIENLWKEYRLGVIGHGTLTHDLQSWWARLRGKEDPNTKIPMLKGQEKQIEGDRFWALRGINLEVKKGEVIGIIGKNGAGKSTLLKILSRVTAPTRGKIKVKGRLASLLEVGTGFHPELTGRENIFMNGAILGMSKQEIGLKLDEIIDFSGVEEFIDTPVKRYSSGMHVRLAFAVAAHLDPEILVVDEVLAVGDVEFQRKCLGKMGEVAKEGRTIFFVSHNMDAIRRLCHVGVLLTNGYVSNHGGVDEVISDYLLKSTKSEGFIVNKSNKQNDIQIKYISLKDKENITKSIFDVGEDVFIDISFEISTPYKGYNISFEVHSLSGKCLFTSSMYDHDTKKYLNNTWESGRYRAKVRLPTELMRSGQYWLQIASTIPKVKVFEKLDELRFDLTDLHGPTVASGEGRRGVILPILHWDIKHCGHKY